jgi:multisubunit Na+/H+ antiporter MnhB subunit
MPWRKRHTLPAAISVWRIRCSATGWQPLALLVDTVLHWPNLATGWLSQVALLACVAGSCVMITTIATGHKPAVTRRFALAQYSIAAVFAAVSLVMFFAAAPQYEMSPQEYLKENLVSSWMLPLLLYVPLALTTLGSWAAAMRYSSR